MLLIIIGRAVCRSEDRGADAGFKLRLKVLELEALDFHMPNDLQ